MVLAEYLHGEAPVLLHRVDDLDAALAELPEPEMQAEFPLGPFAAFRSPGGQRLGLYEATRPHMTDGWEGRQDFS